MGKVKNQQAVGDKVVESKRERFIRVVSPRVNKALKAIRLIGNCAGSAYAFEQGDIDRMFSVLAKSVNEAESKFAAKGQGQAEFSFGANSN